VRADSERTCWSSSARSAAVPVLTAFLRRPSVGGHAVDDVSRLPPQGGYKTASYEAEPCLAELSLARALWRCGDPEGTARRTLTAYADDPRAIYSLYARHVLGQRRRSSPTSR